MKYQVSFFLSESSSVKGPYHPIGYFSKKLLVALGGVGTGRPSGHSPLHYPDTSLFSSERAS
jgi:hypothetical protein